MVIVFDSVLTFRVNSSVQKYMNVNIDMCNICFSPSIFCFLIADRHFYDSFETKNTHDSLKCLVLSILVLGKNKI